MPNYLFIESRGASTRDAFGGTLAGALARDGAGVALLLVQNAAQPAHPCSTISRPPACRCSPTSSRCANAEFRAIGCGPESSRRRSTS